MTRQRNKESQKGKKKLKERTKQGKTKNNLYQTPIPVKHQKNFLVYLEGTLYLTLIERGRDIIPTYRCNIPSTLEEQV
jgi:hypothetical protein